MGKRLVSLKGQGRWGGVTRLHTNDKGQRQFTKLENCYVSQDGQEIRQFPGWAVFVDLTETNNSNGYSRYVPEAVRPVLDYNNSPAAPFYEPLPYAAGTSQSLWSRAKKAGLFGFEQIGNELFIIGESRYRETPIFEVGGDETPLTISQIRQNGGVGVGQQYQIVLGVALNGHSTTDSGGQGLNGIRVGDAVLIGASTMENSDLQSAVDTDLVGKIHQVVSFTPGTGNFVVSTVSTIAFSTNSDNAVDSGGEIHRVRNSRNDDYGTAGIAPYADTYDDRPDDPDALTVWRVQAPLSLTDVTSHTTYPCYPAWVANRQRDFGDDALGHAAEGIILSGEVGSPITSASRREQRTLPFRPCIEPATDRIILAAPQYGCMFQVPSVAPIDPSDWMSPTASGIGIPTRWNGVYDCPRALGVPKARMVESPVTPAQPSPGVIGDGSTLYDVSTITYAGGSGNGLNSGTYRVAIAWEDAGTGDEGLASEIVEVVIPAGEPNALTIRINYVHPGYHFPECLALRMNVYMSEADGEALAFYGSFEMENEADSIAGAGDISAHYGLGIATPADPLALVRSFDLPLLSATGDISSVLDPTRLAPQSASMPRGAEACRYVRGVLFSGGSLGNAGRNGQLWRGKASSVYTGSFWEQDEIIIQSHSRTGASVPASTPLDGDTQEGTLGIAGRAFPDAYQGIEFFEEGLLPGAVSGGRIDRVLNRRVQSLFHFLTPDAGQIRQNYEFLRLERDVWNRSRKAGDASITINHDAPNEDIYYKMPQGQMQIGDPGEPNRASRAFVKVTDPVRGDDLKAFGHLGGNVIACTQKETYSYAWYRNPASEEPQLLSNEFGCIGSNTMVEFDGGLAWISERGPVALGQGLQHVGADIAEDFYDETRRYRRDSTGMMRNAWGVHDASRGLVMWGLTLFNESVTFPYQDSTKTIAGGTTTNDDNVFSRAPCNEVLIWSYRSNAFSTWRPPEGMEIYWMRPLRDADGNVRMCFLAQDGKIYALDDEWGDANGIFPSTSSSQISVTAAAAGTASTTLTFADSCWTDGDVYTTGGPNFQLYVKAGMLVEFLDESGNVASRTTVSSVTTSNPILATTASIELSAAQTWAKGATVRIGGRPAATITSTYVGAETMDTQQVQRVQMRYTAFGSGHANARVKAFKAEKGFGDGEEGLVVTFSTPDVWEAVGYQKPNTSIPAEIDRLGRRHNFDQGQISAPEIAVQVELTGETQIRIQDLSLEVG